MSVNVNSTSADGYWEHTHTGTNAADVVGDATTSATNFKTNATNLNRAVRNRTFGVRGSSDSSFRCTRSYFEFDLSGFTGTATDADFKFYSDSIGSINYNQIYVVEAAALDGSAADFGNVFGTSGTTLGTLLAEGQVSSTAQYHTITGNSALLSKINANVGSGTLTVGVMGYYDYRLAAGISTSWPGAGSSNYTQIEIFYNESGGKEPILEVTGISAASSGYSHNVLGVSSANIASVKGVATANIDNIIGVD